MFVFSLGYLLFKDFCEHLPEDEQIPEIKFYDEVTFISKINLANLLDSYYFQYKYYQFVKI